MITIGYDIHLKTCTVTVVNKNGNKIMRKKLMNEPDILRSFVRQFPGEKQCSMEASYNWPAFYELLKDEVDTFHLLHPKKLRLIAESQNKCDSHDSDTIAYLTHAGFIPHAYKATTETREFRRLLRIRVRTSQYIAAIKNQINAVVNSNIFYSQRPRTFKSLFCKRGLHYLEEAPLPPQARTTIQLLFHEMYSLEKIRDAFDQEIQKVDFKSRDLQWLSTAPGMKGKLFKYIVLAEIDTIQRFRNARALVAYAGLIPRERSSENTIRKGKLRKEANEYLKWALIEATLMGIRRDRGLRHYYREVKQRHDSSAARIAVARKMLTAIYYILKEQRPYYTFKN